MNLNKNPTVEELRELIRKGEDSSGHHVLWVKKSGDVELSQLPMNQTATSFQDAHPDMQIRFRTFQAGNEYVGPEAANDQEWISELFERLVGAWQPLNGKSRVEYLITK